MTLLTFCGAPLLGTQLMFSDLDVFMGESSPYRRLRVLPHLDHASPWLDGDVLELFADRFASVMCDASEKTFEENMRLTARYVEQTKGRVVVEGAVDEILEAGSGGRHNEPTTVEQVKLFLRRTGVDLVVPNVGTEHRATADPVGYLPQRARQISAEVGKILCLHGASSVKPKDLRRLPDDGFIKINVYTTLAVKGGQAVARNVLANLGNIFDGSQLHNLVGKDVLGETTLTADYEQTRMPIGPKLDRVANPPRRDAWFAVVRDRCREFLEIFGFRRYAR
jgi:fructose-bisphosphate aldolase class II